LGGECAQVTPPGTGYQDEDTGEERTDAMKNIPPAMINCISCRLIEFMIASIFQGLELNWGFWDKSGNSHTMWFHREFVFAIPLIFQLCQG